MSFSKRKQRPEKAELIQKYGYDNIEDLLQHLEEQLGNKACRDNLKTSFKIKQQVQYLKLEKKKHIENQKQQIIKQVMRKVDQEKQVIIGQFQVERSQDLKNLVVQMQDLQQQMRINHTEELKKMEDTLESKKDAFINKQTEKQIQLTLQLNNLCKQEIYDEAQTVQKILSNQLMSVQKKRSYEWNVSKTKVLKNLAMKQQKELYGLRARLQKIMDQEIKDKNNEYSKLVKKLDIQKSKMEESLLKNQKFQNELTSLATKFSTPRSRSTSKRSVFVEDFTFDEQKQENDPKTRGSSQIHSYRSLKTPEKLKLQLNHAEI